ncbi:sex peptide receptor-like [Ruditapes philippinarum]|uniref:sex peptide receptor-like n=1 Tax=Ruditapes philippinarum TaxID=129788 RepID=UPI00295AE01A|nr:sex peptide receptor-like [Ruditapes philippinarum]
MDEYMYPGYTFERPVYLYVWETLVVLCCVQNILVLSVFMHRKMRNPTNNVLSAIAVSDCLTGLVTLPAYIMVYQEFDLFIANNYEYGYGNQTTLQPPTHPPVDGYVLTKSLCRGFMFSKDVLSKSFHTISIFLTLFLEIQKYVSMAYPYKYETCFNRLKVVNIYCVLTYLMCPLLYVFHLVREKAEDGLCQWEIPVTECAKDCIYLWVAFVVRHFIPSVTLLTFTILFMYQLKKGEESFKRVDSNSSQYSRRVSENRRICIVVTTVVAVRLVPEIPYCMLLLYNSVDLTFNMGKGIDIETNRIIHMTFELCLIITFLANFYIYIIVNKTFRKHLYHTIFLPLRTKLYHTLSHKRLPFSTLTNRKASAVKKTSVTPGEKIEFKTIQTEGLCKTIK